MSNDSGIYILQTLDGYRIIHTQAIENIYWGYECCDNPNVQPDELDHEDMFYHQTCKSCGAKDPELEKQQEINPEILKEYFGKCIVYNSEEEVLQEAVNIYEEITKDDIGIVEYGISFIKGWADKFFPDIERKI